MAFFCLCANGTGSKDSPFFYGMSLGWTSQGPWAVVRQGACCAKSSRFNDISVSEICKISCHSQVMSSLFFCPPTLAPDKITSASTMKPKFAASCSEGFLQVHYVHWIWTLNEPWSILTIWLMVIPSIIRILIMVIINPYEPLDD